MSTKYLMHEDSLYRRQWKLDATSGINRQQMHFLCRRHNWIMHCIRQLWSCTYIEANPRVAEPGNFSLPKC